MAGVVVVAAATTTTVVVVKVTYRRHHSDVSVGKYTYLPRRLVGHSIPPVRVACRLIDNLLPLCRRRHATAASHFLEAPTDSTVWWYTKHRICVHDPGSMAATLSGEWARHQCRHPRLRSDLDHKKNPTAMRLAPTDLRFSRFQSDTGHARDAGPGRGRAGGPHGPLVKTF